MEKIQLVITRDDLNELEKIIEAIPDSDIKRRLLNYIQNDHIVLDPED